MTTRSLIQWPLPVTRLTQSLRAKSINLCQGVLLSGAICLGTMALASSGAEAAEIRVAIKRNVSQVNIGSSVDAIVQDATGKTIGQIQGMNGFVAERRGAQVALDQWQSNLITVQPNNPEGVVWIGDRWYRGRVVIVPTDDGLTAVNWVDIEQYLYSVLGGEMNGSWHQEALKAQAVAARTYALYKQKNARNGLYDVLATTSSQVYRGIQDESTGTQLAVNATQGQVLTHNNQLILAAFHSSAGGKTDNVEEVWMSPLPYLRAVPDFDQEAPVYQWDKRFKPSEMSRLVNCKGGTVQSFVTTQRTTGGRVRLMDVKTNKGTCRMDGDDIRRKLNLRSSKFEIVLAPRTIPSQDGKSPTKVMEFVVTGKGFGHGLGMSQYGALGMAKQGYTYDRIVAHYYQQTRLSRIASS